MMVQKEQMIFQLNRIKTKIEGALLRIEEKHNNQEITVYTRDSLRNKYQDVLARVEGRIVEDEILGEFQIPLKKLEYRQTLYTPDLVFGVFLIIIGIAVYIYTKMDMTLLEPLVIPLGTNRTGEIWQDYNTSLLLNIASAIVFAIGTIITLNELVGKKK
ncbi:MAG: hypothetical protein SCH39_00660 [Methanosarcinales archaeon]|nr:hypothetical protein [ANME-2 cluster archaeon]MDF1531205.1 hypothetical protein [ANME-2 cluster archaeon]MDW7774829.1 hypothetical protein [Methanosarcinales archaeon]